jgi:protocatechuate 3,4-dioxygenase beta subunit
MIRRSTIGWVLAALAMTACADGRTSLRAEADGPRPELVVLAPDDEPGERIAFTGVVLDHAGYPLARAAVVAYQTDRTGIYNSPDARSRVPRLRAVAVTDEAGRFGFSTIRPGPYPGASNPAHIHLEVCAPAHHVCYLEYWFDDDPLVTEERRAVASREEDIEVVTLLDTTAGLPSFHHEIRLAGD